MLNQTIFFPSYNCLLPLLCLLLHTLPFCIHLAPALLYLHSFPYFIILSSIIFQFFLPLICSSLQFFHSLYFLFQQNPQVLQSLTLRVFIAIIFQLIFEFINFFSSLSHSFPHFIILFYTFFIFSSFQFLFTNYSFRFTKSYSPASPRLSFVQFIPSLFSLLYRTFLHNFAFFPRFTFFFQKILCFY